jgi:hypothetical protein
MKFYCCQKIFGLKLCYLLHYNFSHIQKKIQDSKKKKIGLREKKTCHYKIALATHNPIPIIFNFRLLNAIPSENM